VIRQTLTILVLVAGFLATVAFAVEPDEILADPALEARARSISKKLRCVVCQNQDIDSSNAGVARDLRILVRERLTAGDTETAVLDFVAARYGDYVLLKPPFKPETYALWAMPVALILIAGGAGLLVLNRAQRHRPSSDFSVEEEQLIADLVPDRNEGDD
jgi:cytochrome c-type biogenesis protein CcmH